jgi:hypothetical protein
MIQCLADNIILLLTLDLSSLSLLIASRFTHIAEHLDHATTVVTQHYVD